jgi:hypothetical protein
MKRKTNDENTQERLSFFDKAKNEIISNAKNIFKELNGLEIETKIETINEIRRILHEYSPFSYEPVDFISWVKNDLVVANDYNPNKVAPPEMNL